MWQEPKEIISFPPFTIYVFDVLPSTNDIAHSFKKIFPLSSLYPIPVFWAKSQDKGRGRMERTWASPPGNLYASFLFCPDSLPFQRFAELSFLLGAALCQTLQSFVQNSCNIQLKWPNDVLLQGRKGAGILLETDMSLKEPSWVVGGIGVNLISSPTKNIYPTTCLQDILGKESLSCPTPLAFLQKLCQEIESFCVPYFEEKDFDFIRKKWLTYAAFLNQEVTITIENRTLKGIFEGLDKTGALILNMGTEKRIVSSGDVFFYEGNSKTLK